MPVQSLANEMKSRVELMGRQAQDVVETCLGVNRRACGIFFGNTQTFAKAELDNAREFYDTTFERFNEARRQGPVNMAFVPVSVAPAGRETMVAAFRDAREHFAKTRDELLGVYRSGYEDIWRTMSHTRDDVQRLAAKSAVQVRRSAKRTEAQVEEAATDARRAGKDAASRQARKTPGTGAVKRKTTTRRSAGGGASGNA